MFHHGGRRVLVDVADIGEEKTNENCRVSILTDPSNQPPPKIDVTITTGQPRKFKLHKAGKPVHRLILKSSNYHLLNIYDFFFPFIFNSLLLKKSPPPSPFLFNTGRNKIVQYKLGRQSFTISIMTTELHLLRRRYLSVKINDPPPPHPSFVFKSLFQKLFFFFVFSYWRVGILNRPDQTGRSEYSVSWFDAHRILCFSHFFFLLLLPPLYNNNKQKTLGWVI